MVTTQLLGRDYFISGDEIDEFILLEIFGSGGEGGIWSAWDTLNKRIVALKFFQLDETTRTIDKRRAELLALAKIEHANIRQVYKTGEDGGFLYFVIAYYPSGSLADYLGGKPLDAGSVLKIAAQITSALEFVHAKHVIHRDLKPTNILLDHQHHAFLTDFGIARTLSDSTMVLHTGQGTPAYSSPEQHTKAFLDALTDIYSFGVMLYEMFTGVLPWQGLTSLAIKQLESGIEIPDPRESNPELPEDLHQALRQITAQHPGDRPATIRQAYELVLGAWDVEDRQAIFSGQAVSSLDDVLAIIPPPGIPDVDRTIEAAKLLARVMRDWRALKGKYRIGLTEFIYLDDIYRRAETFGTLDKNEISLLAMFSIVHGRNTSFWWGRVESVQEKLVIAENILSCEEAGSTVLNLLILMLRDPAQFSGVARADEQLIRSVLEQINSSPEPAVTQKAIELVDRLAVKSDDWRPNGFSKEVDKQLAEMSLSDQVYAIDAAHLIGKIKSSSAVGLILQALKNEDNQSGWESLVIIRQTAGSWPKGLPFRFRVKTWWAILQEQVLTDWSQMGRLFLISWLGAGLAFFFNVFFTTRLPSYLITSRLLNSIGCGLFFGPFLGAGIAVAQWISRRLVVLRKISRLAVAVVSGGVLVNLGFVLYHYLFLSSPPTGFLILLGSMISTFGFALGGIFELSKIWRTFLNSLFVFTGLFFSYIFAENLVVSPMLYYEDGEPLRSIILMVGFACIIGIVTFFIQDAKQEELF